MGTCFHLSLGNIWKGNRWPHGESYIASRRSAALHSWLAAHSGHVPAAHGGRSRGPCRVIGCQSLQFEPLRWVCGGISHGPVFESAFPSWAMVRKRFEHDYRNVSLFLCEVCCEIFCLSFHWVVGINGASCKTSLYSLETSPVSASEIIVSSPSPHTASSLSPQSPPKTRSSSLLNPFSGDQSVLRNLSRATVLKISTYIFL